MAKRIVIFADRTGNAFTTRGSNVWRLYEALDKSQPEHVLAPIDGTLPDMDAALAHIGYSALGRSDQLHQIDARAMRPAGKSARDAPT
jgi:hypothetical protein